MEIQRKRRIRILLERIQDKKIYLYGAGTRGRVAMENLAVLGLCQGVSGFVDDKASIREYCGKQVLSTEVLNNFDFSDAVFIITAYEVNKMANKLMANNILPEHIYYLPELLINDIDANIFRENSKEIAEVYNILYDNLSKYIYKSLFDIYIDGNIGILSRTKGGIQYFPIDGFDGSIEEFHLSKEEIFVDCGSYDGDTIRKFKELTANQYKKIWAFEPDADNYSKLSDYIKRKQDTRIESKQGGVYSSNTVMYFDGNRGTTSMLARTGEKSINVYQLDSLIKEPVTFIKMDIEGSEKEALMGAKRIIAEHKPKLAICIYHKTEDFWQIPLLIKSLNPDYHIYIRNYEDRVDETVCYAI